ncbi:MAG: hypothetical protein E6J87_03630 [Deltaproteobacteria bacterium]|nr:MAG: hypothetical protein E6J87_03630 [Deltaproteobacteria bacterium]
MRKRKRAALGFLLGSAALLAVGGCRTVMPAVDGGQLSYFTPPAPDDAWSRKIRGWQQRELGAPSGPAPVGAQPPRLDPAEHGSLRDNYNEFLVERKRQVASELAVWIQEQSRDHYIPDGPVDHWATFEETLRNNGDDCDGLELLAYHFLRELGFREDEVYRAIVVRPADGQHHMVTLWFETPNDPWVIDPTGAMTTGMPRMSQVPGWKAIKVFSEKRDFTVAPSQLSTAQR